jgi:Allene oxide cyclase barrel like domain
MRKFGVVFALGVMAVAVWAASASAIGSPRVFSLLSVQSQRQLPPIGGFTFQHHPQGGDSVQFQDDLYRWAGNKRGARAGRDHGMVTFLVNNRAAGASVFGTVQFYLQSGTILVEGIFHFPGSGPARFTLPIVGGTGGYAGVRGYVNVRDLGDGNQNKGTMEFHLLP